ncbi:MAG: rhomboid family intramembrane serine protease [Candidatus Eisenbacteria bacterium]|uniref:Rhomboid family intramembrane serine protease n=1 Tax=Eiseniibacteriota bacterium TaxID=2212470 RepID=A0A538T4H2_UNCEI|nr:MAG: rhomboid family intramembrane serine protease [Candidatus Eisenbacteria bacterium]
MIPLRDRNPSGAFPVVTLTLILVNTFVFLYEVQLGPALGNFLNRYALVPAEVTGSLQYGAVSLSDTVAPFFTSMFLHGGWLHLIMNMWFLWIFGDNVEDALGAFRYILFYLICGLGAAFTHFLLQPASPMPVLGASGAIAGVLGAYAVLFPGARVITLIPVFFFLQVVELPALVVLGLWFVLQIMSGFFEVMAPMRGGTAWWAHIGGFVTGLFLILLFRPRKVSI